MKRHGLAAIALLLLWGCSFRAPATAPAEVPGPTLLTEVSSWTPASIPLVPALDPSQADDIYAAPASNMQVISSREEMTAFIDQFPKQLPPHTPVVPPGMPVPSPVVQDVLWPDSMTAFDFEKYRAVAFTAVGTHTTMARIVGVEEQPNRLVVHTVQWNKSSPHHRNSFVHVVGVPRSDKPIEFAATLQKSLATSKVYPSPQVGVPDARPVGGTAVAGPTWRSIPNPELTKDKVESLVRHRLQSSEIAGLTLKKQTLQSVAGNMGEELPWPLLPESEVWVADVQGNLKAGGMSGEAPDAFRSAQLFLTVDTGHVLSLAAKP